MNDAMFKMLAVDETTNYHRIREAIRNLRRTAAMGRLAEKALASIEKNGYYEGRVRTFAARRYYDGTVMCLKRSKMTEREAAPDFKDLKIGVGQMKAGYHGGHDFQVATVNLIGTMFIQDEKNPEKWGEDDRKIGVVRFKKNGFSFEPLLRNHYDKGPVVNLYTKYGSEASQATLKAIGKAIGFAMTNRRTDQFSETIARKIESWVVMEGVAQDLALSLLAQAKIASVMEG